jgi:hypothetical protein
MSEHCFSFDREIMESKTPSVEAFMAMGEAVNDNEEEGTDP